MANENSPAKEAPNYEARIAQHEEAVAKLAEDYEKKPSPELKMQLDRKTDALLHLKNLAKGNSKERAKQAAEKARITTLSKAVTQPLKMP
jgi:hypothetical protein